MVKKVCIVAIILLSSLWIFAQDFSLTNNISSSDNINIQESALVSDGFVVFGNFRGTLNDPPYSTATSFDMFLAKFDLNFNLIWLDTIGGAGIDFAYDMAITTNEDILIVGAFRDDCKFEGTTLNSAGNYDSFIARYSSNGSLIWARNIATNDAAQLATAVDEDKNTDIIVAGYYTDSIRFENGTSYTNPNSGIYIVKLDQNGNLNWATLYERNDNKSRIYSLDEFSDGYYFSGNFLDTVDFQITEIGSVNQTTTDVFVLKTNYSGYPQWVRRSYGDGNTNAGIMTQDIHGNIYFTGYYEGTYLENDSTESLKANKVLGNNGDSDIFLTKYNKDGNLIWAKEYGEAGSDWARGIKYQNDFLYLSGYFSDSLVFGNDIIKSTGIGDVDAFIGMVDVDGVTLKAVSVGSSDGEDSGTSISSDSENNAYWGGYYKSTSFTIGDSTYINPVSGKSEVFIAKYKPPFIGAVTKTTDITCMGEEDGEIIVTPYFGVPPFSYSWSHNAMLNDSTATGLGAMSYSVTITDAIDSTVVINYDLTDPDSISFNPVITNVSTCSYSEEALIDLNAAGGNGGYTYQWQASEGGYGIVLSAEDQSGLTIGRYDVTITDSKSCTNDTSIYITGPDPITFGGSVVTDSSGIGPGAIDLVYFGGYGDPSSFTFDWIGPSGLPATHSEDTTNLSPGNYSVTVTDVHFCEFDTTFNVANLDTFYVFISDQKDACNGTINGSAAVSYYSPKGHTIINYLWDANAGSQTTAQATGLAPGRYYQVTVTDTENTPNTVLVDSVYIDELAYVFAGSLSGTTTLDCYGDSTGYIDLTINTAGTLPYTYSWSNGSTLQDLTDLKIGSYSVTVTDINECEFSITNYIIDQPTELIASAEKVSDPSCYGSLDGELTVDRNGGTLPYTYIWDDPAAQDTKDAVNLGAGTYNVTVTDFNNCTTTSSAQLTEPDVISIAQDVVNEACNAAAEGVITLTVTGGTTPFAYSWTTVGGSGLSPANKNQSGLTAGKYYFTATDNNNCVFEDSVEITEPTVLEITDETKTDVTDCNGYNTGTITIVATGGTGSLTYTLNPGAVQSNSTGIFTGIGAGSYTVDVEDQNACVTTSNLTEITEPTAINITEDEVNDAICNGENDGSVEISVSGGTVTTSYGYTWSTTDGSGLIQDIEDQLGIGAGTYYLTVTDDNSCEAIINVVLNEPDTIILSKTIYNPSCNGDNDGSIVLNHTGGEVPFSYYWTTTDGSGLQPVNRNQGGLTAGTYYLEVTDALDCIINDTITITAPPTIAIDTQNSTDATDSNTADGTITITASGGTGTLTYLLKPDNISNQTGAFTSVLPGEYVVEVDDIYFCGPIITDTITVGAINSIDLIFAGDFIKIYPNPASDKVFVEIDMNGTFNLELAGMSGQILYQDEIVSNGLIKEEIDLSSFPKGIYLLRVHNNEYYITDKVILQ